MRNFNFKETEKYLKRCIKKKINFCRASVIAFLLTGIFSTTSYSDWLAINTGQGTAGKASRGDAAGENNTVGNIILAKYNDSYKTKKSVVIGSGDTYGKGDGNVIIGYEAKSEKGKATVIGYEAKALEERAVVVGEGSVAAGAQSVALGSKVEAKGNQSTALGNNVVAGGYASIALGSDDVGEPNKTTRTTRSKFYDKYVRPLPKNIYDLIVAEKDTTFSNMKTDSIFKPNNKNNNEGIYSVYSPTWAKGASAIAIGGRSVAYGAASLAVGTLSIAKGDLSTAIGSNSAAFEDYSQAIGSDTFIYAPNSVGVGSNIQVLKQGGMAYGYNANSGGIGAIAIGTDVSANTLIDDKVKYNEFFMHTSSKSNIKSTIMGFDVNGSAKVAADNKNLDSGDYFGKYKYKGYIDRLEEAINATDFVKEITEKEEGSGIQKIQPTNKDESKAAKYAIVIGSRSGAMGDNSMAFGRGTFAKEKNAIAIGSYSYNIAENTISIGLATKGLAKNSVVIGVGSGVDFDAENSTVLGTGSASLGKNSGILGVNSRAWGTNVFVIGNNSEASGESNLIFGSETKINGVGNNGVINSIAIGKGVELKKDPKEIGEKTSSMVVIGNEAKGYFENSVAIGYRSETDYNADDLKEAAYMPDGSFSLPSSKKTGIVSVGRKGAERRITNVAGGFLPTDAVNVSQLKALEDKVDGSSLNDEIEDKSNVPYYAINLGENQIQNPATRKAAWKKYIDLQKTKKVLENRKINNGEDIDQSFTDKLDKEIEKLEIKYTKFKEKLGTDFTSISIDEGSNDLEKRTKFKENNDKIEAKAKESLKKGNLTTEEIVKLKESNYSSQLAYGSNSMAIGYKAQAGKATFKDSDKEHKNPTVTDGSEALAVGIEAKAYGNKTVAVGNKSEAEGERSIAIGAYNQAGKKPNLSNPEILLDDKDRVTKAVGQTSIAIGSGAQAQKNDAIAIGRSVDADEASVSIGGISRVMNKYGIAIGYDSLSATTEGIAIGHNAKALSKNKNTIGKSIAIGAEAVSDGAGNIAIGSAASSKNDNKSYGDSISIGTGATTSANQAIALGKGAKAENHGAIAIGRSIEAKGDSAIAIGTSITSNKASSVVIGHGASVTFDNSVAIGKDSTTTAILTNSGYDPSTNKMSTKSDATWKPNKGEFAIGNKSTSTRRITGVAAGSADTDAVNVAQLKKVTSSAISLDNGNSSALTYNNGKLKLDETTLITNLNNGANIGSPVPTNKRLVTDKDVHDYINDKKIIFEALDNKGTISKVNNNDAKYTFNIKELNDNSKNSLYFQSGEAVEVVGLGDKLGFKFDVKESGISSKHLAKDSVTTEKILNGNVTEEKLAGDLKNKIEKINDKADRSEIKAYENLVEKAISNLDDKANKSLDNIDTSGENKIKQVAKVSIVVEGVEKEIVVTSKDNGNSKTFKVGLAEDIKNEIKAKLDTDTYTDDKAKTEEKINNKADKTKVDELDKKVDKNTENIAKKLDTDEFNKFKDKGITFKSDNNKTTSAIKLGETLSINGDTKNITTTVDNGGIKVALNSKLTNIDSIESTSKNKIELKDNEGIKLISDSKTVTIKGDKISGVSTIEKDTNNSFKFGKSTDGNSDTATIKIGGKDLTLSKSGNKIKLSGIADGEDNNDAVNVEQLNSVKQSLTDATIKYKATPAKDGQAIDQTVKLSEGLNFTSTSNITTEVEKNGVVKHSLNSKLTGIEEINKKTNGAALKLDDNKASLTSGENKAKIEVEEEAIKLTSNAKTITFDKNGKLLGLADGKISNDSTDAITGKQIYAIEREILGLTENKDKTDFEKLSFTKLKNDKSSTTELLEEKSFKKAIEDNIAAINKGFKFEADQYDKDASKNQTQYLGSTTTIKAGDFTENDKNGANREFKGKNLKTQYEYKEGNGTVTIGLSENPEFKSIEFKNGNETDKKVGKITVDNDGTISVKHGDANASKIATKDMLDGLTISFKNNGNDDQNGDAKGKAFTRNLTDGFNFINGTNITSEAKKDGTVKFNLNKALIGIDSIENNSKKIELKDDVIKLTTGNDKTVSIKDNILSGVNKVGTDKVNISFEVESDKNGSKTPSKAKINIDDKSVDFAVSTKDGETDKILISNVGTPLSKFDAANKEYVDSQIKNINDNVGNIKIKYKASQKDGTITGKEEEVSLGTGLNFKSTDNIKTGVKENGEITHTLNKKLTGIEEINKAENQGALKLTEKTAILESSKDNSNIKLEANKATLSAGKDKANIEVGENEIKLTSANGKELKYDVNGKLSGLTNGTIGNKSTEVITGAQLYDLGSKLGLEVDTNKVQFKNTEFSKLKDKKGNEVSLKNNATFKDVIEANISAINRGFKVAGDKYAVGTTYDKTQYLGSTINVKAKDLTETSSTSFKGKNLRTEYEYKEGNGIISIGLTENPEFKSVKFKLKDDADKISKISTDDEGNIIITTQKDKASTDTTNDKTIKIEGDKVSGIATVEKDKDNTITLGKEKDGKTSTIIKVGGADLTLEKVSEETKPTNGVETKKEEKVRLSGLAKGEKSDDAVTFGQLEEVKNSVTNQSIKYKASKFDGTIIDKQEEVALSSGLNFKSTDNITTKVAKDGVITHTLNSTLTGITEINKEKDKATLKLNENEASLESAKDNSNVKLEENKATLSAGKDKANIEVGENEIKLTSANGKELKYDVNGKLSGLTNGTIVDKSTEAITGAQLYDLGSKLGLTVKDDNGFNSPDFTKKLKNEKGKEVSLKTNATFKDAIEANIEAINRGFKVTADQNEKNSNNKTQYLGSTISIKSGDIETNFKSKNLKTEYTYDKGNGKVSIGLSENPEFKSVEFKSKDDVSKNSKISTDDEGNLIITTQIENDNNGKVINIKGDEVTGVKTIGLDKYNISFEEEKSLDNGEKTPAKAKINLDGTSIEFSKVSEKIKNDGNVETEEKLIRISNVATPDKDYDAVNKKYVDEKLSDNNDKLDLVNENIPISYTDKDGNKLVKKEGKFYKTKDGKPTKETVDDKDVFVSIKDGEKLSSALGLNKDSKENDIKSAIDKLLDNITTNGNTTDKFNLSNVATLRDLQALGKVGMDFEGDYGLNDENAKLIHNNLGQKLIIKGKIKKGGTAVDKDKLTDGNIGVIADKDAKTLSIGLSKDLINLESAEFTTDENRGGNTTQKVKTKINGSGTSIVELQEDGKTEKLNGKKAEYTLDGSKVNDGENKETVVNSEGTIVTDKNDKKQTKVNADGTTIKELDEKGQEKIDGKTAEYKLDGSKVTDGTNTTETKADGTTVKGQDGKEAEYKADKIAIKNQKDGKFNDIITIKNNNGIGEISFAKETKDGKESGTGKIIGLADLNEKSDGTSAVNKNYVDDKLKESNEKLQSVNDNIPVIYIGENGKKIARKGNEFFEVDENGKITETKYTGKVYTALKDFEKQYSGLGLNKESKEEDITKALNTLLSNDKDNAGNVKATDHILNNIATIRDLQVLGQAGLNFVGNDKDTILHKNLGQTLTIKGSGEIDKNTFAGSKGNINVKVEENNQTKENEMIIELSKKLENLESAVFDKKDANGKKVGESKIDGHGLVIKETAENGNQKDKGKVAEYKLEGSKFSDGKGKETTVNVEGTTVKDGTNTTETKADGITIKDKKDGTEKEVISIKNKDGKGEINFAKESEEGNAKGTGTITGLKDLEEDSDGTSAANKNYVDTRISELTDNLPIKYEDKNGEKLVKGKDGKLYKLEDIKNKKYVKDKGGYVDPKDEKSTPVKDVKDAKAVLDPNSKLSGINSGIGLDGNKDDEISKNFINNNLDDKTSKNAVNVKDLHSVSKAIIDKGITFGSDNGTAHKKLGETLNINGGSNINTEIKGGNLVVNLNDEITLSSKTKEALSEEEAKVKGLTEADRVKDDDGGYGKDDKGNYLYNLPKTSTKYTYDGLDILGPEYNSASYKVSGVKLRDKDLNTSKLDSKELMLSDKEGNTNTISSTRIQLGDNISLDSKEAKIKAGNISINANEASISGLVDLNENSSGDLAANKNYVDSKAKEIKASSNGAIAGAIAMANLPQVSGNSIANVSAALGYQDKSVALALGVSGTNKKGNVVYKASGSINTQANVSLGAGLGYQFGVNRYKELVDINSIKKVVNKHTLKLRELEAKNKQLEKEVKLNKENYNKLANELKELKELIKLKKY